MRQVHGVSEGAQGLSGVLRISAPVTFGEVYVVGMLGRFAEAHPGLTLDLRLNDRYVDRAAEGVDVAFRLGRFELASLKVRQFGRFQSVPVAGPDYIARKGAPKSPQELADHDCIVDTNRRNPRRWVFTQGTSEIVANVGGRFHVNSASAAAALAKGGLGVAYVPRFAVQAPVLAGQLVTLLNGYTGESAPVGAVYPEGRTTPRKVRALIDFAYEDIKSSGLLAGG